MLELWETASNCLLFSFLLSLLLSQTEVSWSTWVTLTQNHKTVVQLWSPLSPTPLSSVLPLHALVLNVIFKMREWQSLYSDIRISSNLSSTPLSTLPSYLFFKVLHAFISTMEPTVTLSQNLTPNSLPLKSVVIWSPALGIYNYIWFSQEIGTEFHLIFFYRVTQV